ncbi:hypothetical protein B0H14DRAFT_2556948 [Mycena olivaceomarginata]|nr:hypothetical protein B0H14DRAFT_2556948 [Mycena olivaceomarginata]
MPSGRSRYWPAQEPKQESVESAPVHWVTKITELNRVCSHYIRYGNDASMGHIYGNAALFVRVPAFNDGCTVCVHALGVNKYPENIPTKFVLLTIRKREESGTSPLSAFEYQSIEVFDRQSFTMHSEKIPWRSITILKKAISWRSVTGMFRGEIRFRLIVLVIMCGHSPLGAFQLWGHLVRRSPQIWPAGEIERMPEESCRMSIPMPPRLDDLVHIRERGNPEQFIQKGGLESGGKEHGSVSHNQWNEFSRGYAGVESGAGNWRVLPERDEQRMHGKARLAAMLSRVDVLRGGF